MSALEIILLCLLGLAVLVIVAVFVVLNTVGKVFEGVFKGLWK